MHNEAANKTRSFNKNCPGAPERAGKPPADGSITPGVVSINVRVIKNVIADIKPPNADKIGLNAPSNKINAVSNSIQPKK